MHRCARWKTRELVAEVGLLCLWCAYRRSTIWNKAGLVCVSQLLVGGVLHYHHWCRLRRDVYKEKYCLVATGRFVGEAVRTQQGTNDWVAKGRGQRAGFGPRHLAFGLAAARAAEVAAAGTGNCVTFATALLP